LGSSSSAAAHGSSRIWGIQCRIYYQECEHTCVPAPLLGLGLHLPRCVPAPLLGLGQVKPDLRSGFDCVNPRLPVTSVLGSRAGVPAPFGTGSRVFTERVQPRKPTGKGETQVGEQRLNLNRSWYKDHSHAYNTPFYFKSYTEDLSHPIFTSAFKLDTPSLSGGGLNAQS
jgi:hypothetical protein